MKTSAFINVKKTSKPCREDEVIAKILSIKKPPNSVKTEEEKVKIIANEKTSYPRG